MKLGQHKNLLPIYLILLADVLAFTVPLPLLPFYMEQFAATPLTIGFLAMTFGLCQFVAGPVLGMLSDRIGRKSILVVSQIGTFLGLLLLAYSPFMQQTVTWIFIARAIDGMTAGNISVAHAYVADITPAKNRATAFALLGTVFGIGFMIGPSLSSLLIRFGFQVPILVAAGFSAISIVFTWRLMPGGQRPVPVAVASNIWKTALWAQLARLFRNKKIRWPLTQQAAFALAFSLYFFGLPLFAERRFAFDGQPFNVREVGFIFLATGTLSLVLQTTLVGRLAKRFGEERLVHYGFCLAAVGYAVLASASSVPILALSLLCIGIGNTILRPALAALISRGTPASEQGLTMGALQSLYSISDIGAPVLAGWILNHQGDYGFVWQAIWALAACMLAVFGVTLSVIIRRARCKKTVQERSEQNQWTRGYTPVALDHM